MIFHKFLALCVMNCRYMRGTLTLEKVNEELLMTWQLMLKQMLILLLLQRRMFLFYFFSDTQTYVFNLKSVLIMGFFLPKLVSLLLGLQHVTTLQKLRISTCKNLTAIREWIRNCTSLQVLQIDGCSSLTSLPEGMRSLTSLQRLEIKNCPSYCKDAREKRVRIGARLLTSKSWNYSI
jgi:hypothetical protein